MAVQRDSVGTAVWLAVAAMLVLLAGTEYARRRMQFRYASAPLWPRPDGSTRPVARPLSAFGSASTASGRSYGEVWDLDMEAGRAA